MTLYLLDTNIVSEIAKNPHGEAAASLARIDKDEVAVSAIVAAELRYGRENNPDSKNASKALQITNAMVVYGFDEGAASQYEKVRSFLRRAGHSMTPMDLLIAAHALALNATLVTDDRAFESVPGLKVENWMR